MKTKTCNQCGRTKPYTEFWTRVSSRDGLNRACKDCVTAYKQRYKAMKREADRVNSAMDPLAFSVTASLHIKNYLEGAVQRFESRTSMESPPQLRAIIELANQVVADAPAPNGADLKYDKTCELCGAEFRSAHHYARFCSSRCGTKSWSIRNKQRLAEHQRLYYQRKSQDPGWMAERNRRHRERRSLIRAASAGHGADK